MIKLRRFLKGYKKEVIIGPLCKLFEAILELFVPLVMANIIDVGINELHDTGYVLRMGGVLILLAATGLTSALFCQYFASKASQGAGTEIRRALFRHINSLSHAELDRLGTPSLITRITNDTNQVQQNIAMCIRLLTRAPFIIIGSLIMAMSINLRMSLIFFGAALLIALTLYIVMSRSVPLYAAVQKKLDKIGLISRENLSGNRVIRAFSKQNTEKARVDAATEDLTRTSVRVSKLSALLSPITYLVTDCAIIAIVWFGAVNVNAGGMKTGDIVALVSYMTQILLAMVVVANLVILMTKAGASAKRINEVFETKPSVAEINHDYISAKENTPKIEFRNVRFNYSSDGDDELSGISFPVKNGQTVGIIGGTGSGKSTLISLIPRFYDTSDGAVLVDWTLVVPAGLPPIPRVGLSFTAPKAAEVSWLGRGPWENYSDRHDSAMFGAYKASVGLVSGLADPGTGTIAYPTDRLNPDNYTEPGEQGYRMDCRSMTVGGVTVTAVNAPFGFNVWPYPQTMLEGKAHQWELSEADELTVNIDAVQMGVGGDDSWGARPHGEFMPGAGTYRLSFIVKGL